MDYLTKQTSRMDLLKYAIYLRKLFDVPLSGSFPVLNVLDRLPEIFPGSDYTIVEDDKLPPKTMAQCYQNEKDGMTIEIKESVYIGAYDYNIGACRGFICHEICHVFLFYIGFIPVCVCSFTYDEIPPCFEEILSY